jgi:peptidoglycan/LPS O-acetylase OafA/YrhL
LCPLQATDAFWHITNFFAPALVVGGIAAVLARLVWRRELRARSVWRLWAWAGGASALASIAGLVVFEHDGKMATYGAMVVACAAALWWAGLRGR